ncbi:alpha/beta hydrolase [Rhodocytophaga aerolata]|uniref:Alpha/beta hydrolase n=1 Tax=Rhodocytophaga aerolata TaxID=455078 RepID=A0ABT8RH43_9BACT|nr:alpha/beta hydrolase [Rhodocytophaga aerolata]MDO1451432.1 alpha/beta hydrolase [Rhodocytophaga aerolata]
MAQKIILFISFYCCLLTLKAIGQSRFISLDGAKIFTITKGLEKRKAGQPVIVFESGLGTPVDNWDTILDQAASLAPVVAYDRPGIGQSEADQEMPTTKNVADKLRRILQTLKLEPPYLLVGHSLGGAYVRGFALYYPTELAGLVIIDPADFTETNTDWGLQFEALGYSQAKIDSMVTKRRQEAYVPIREAPLSIQEEYKILFDLRKADFTEMRSTPLPNIPVAMVVSGGYFPAPKATATDEALFHTKMKYRMARWINLVNTIPKGRFFYHASAGHFVHRDDPELVMASIRIVLMDYEQERAANKEKRN